MALPAEPVCVLVFLGLSFVDGGCHSRDHSQNVNGTWVGVVGCKQTGNILDTNLIYFIYTLVPLLLLIIVGCGFYRLTKSARNVYGLRPRSLDPDDVPPPSYDVALTHPKPEVIPMSTLPSYEASTSDPVPEYTAVDLGPTLGGATTTPPPSPTYTSITSPGGSTSPPPYDDTAPPYDDTPTATLPTNTSPTQITPSSVLPSSPSVSTVAASDTTSSPCV